MSNITRDWSSLFKTGEDINNNSSTSYFGQNNYSFFSFGFGGQKDDRIGDPKLIQNLCQNNPLLFGIFNRINDVVTSSGFEVYEIVKGEVRLTKPSIEYKKLLLDIGIKSHINNMLIASYSSGLGNALCYKINNKGKVEYKVDPFIMNGTYRVELEADNLNNEIIKYKVVNNHGDTLYSFDPKQVYHYKHSNPDGNIGFGSNGVLVASKILQLYYNIMTFNATHFGNNLFSPRLYALDFAYMEKAGYSHNDLQKLKSSMAEDMKQGMGLQNNGRPMLLNYPLQDVSKEPQTNSQTRAVELLEKVILKEICHSMGVDENIFNIGNAKYDNAEKLQDQLYQQVKPTTIKIQEAVESFHLPNLDPEFDNSRFIFRFKRLYSQEEIDIKKVKQEETKIWASNIKTLSEVYSQYNVGVFPTEAKMKELEELQNITFKQLNKEEVKLEPAKELQISDNFTQITNAESVNRSYWDTIQSRLDTSFKNVLENV